MTLPSAFVNMRHHRSRLVDPLAPGAVIELMAPREVAVQLCSRTAGSRATQPQDLRIVMYTATRRTFLRHTRYSFTQHWRHEPDLQRIVRAVGSAR